jgi:hypothetical protein
VGRHASTVAQLAALAGLVGSTAILLGFIWALDRL